MNFVCETFSSASKGCGGDKAYTPGTDTGKSEACS